jgi:hypothetical protein
VLSVETLEKIADGLVTPRAWWRLSGNSGGMIDVDETARVGRQLAADVAALGQRVESLLVAVGVESTD